MFGNSIHAINFSQVMIGRSLLLTRVTIWKMGMVGVGCRRKLWMGLLLDAKRGPLFDLDSIYCQLKMVLSLIYIKIIIKNKKIIKNQFYLYFSFDISLFSVL